VIRSPSVIGRIKILKVSIITNIKIKGVGLDLGTKCVKILSLFFMKFIVIAKKNKKDKEKLTVAIDVIEKL